MIEIEKKQVSELWVSKIMSFILNLNINNSLKERVRECLLNQEDLIKNGMITNEIFGTSSYKIKSIELFSNECLSFINYLNNILNTKGEEYFKMAIEYSLANSDISFIDNFIRFIVITNFNDIEIIDDINTEILMKKTNDYNAGTGSMRAYLGGFLLCDLSEFSLHQNKNGSKYLDFYNFHSRNNLTRTKVGTLLLKKMLEKMLNDSILCDCSLGSVWVMKNNTLGKKFYEKFGFKFLDSSGKIVDYNYYDDYIKVKKEDYPNLSDTEFNNLRNKMSGNFGIVIPAEEKQKILMQQFSYPYIEFDGKKIDCTTEFNCLSTKDKITNFLKSKKKNAMASLSKINLIEDKNKDGDNLFYVRADIFEKEFTKNYYSSESIYYAFDISGNYVGYVRIFVKNDIVPKTVEMEYGAPIEYQNKGNITLLAQVAIRDIFENKIFDNLKVRDGIPTTCIENIMVYIHKTNNASLAVSKKLGFDDSGNLHKTDYLKQKEHQLSIN